MNDDQSTISPVQTLCQQTR